MPELHHDPIRPLRPRWCPECYRLTSKYHPNYACNECGQATIIMPDGGAYDDDPRIQQPDSRRAVRPPSGQNMRPR